MSNCSTEGLAAVLKSGFFFRTADVQAVLNGNLPLTRFVQTPCRVRVHLLHVRQQLLARPVLPLHLLEIELI